MMGCEFWAMPGMAIDHIYTLGYGAHKCFCIYQWLLPISTIYIYIYIYIMCLYLMIWIQKASECQIVPFSVHFAVPTPLCPSFYCSFVPLFLVNVSKKAVPKKRLCYLFQSALGQHGHAHMLAAGQRVILCCNHSPTCLLLAWQHHSTFKSQGERCCQWYWRCETHCTFLMAHWTAALLRPGAADSYSSAHIYPQWLDIILHSSDM